MEQITQNDTAVYTIKTSVEIAQQYVTFFPFSKKMLLSCPLYRIRDATEKEQYVTS